MSSNKHNLSDNNNPPDFFIFKNINEVEAITKQAILEGIAPVINTRICNKYWTLLNYSIKSLDFELINIMLHTEFNHDVVLRYELKVIEDLAKRIQSLKKLEFDPIYEQIQLNTVVNIFLNQIRYDEKIWFRLRKYHKQIINRLGAINWDALFAYVDLGIVNVYHFKLTYLQKLLIKRIMRTKPLKIDYYLEFQQNISFKKVQSVISMFNLYKLSFRCKKLTSSSASYRALQYAIINQIISIFIRENITKNQT